MADLTPKEKEVWAGVRRPGTERRSEAAAEKDKLQKNIGWSTYQSDITGSAVGGYSEHDSYLQNNAGFASEEAQSLNDKIKNNLPAQAGGQAWSYYEGFVSDQGGWGGWANLFSTQNQFGSDLDSEDGGAAAGVRVFESGGYTHDGEQAPAGAIEVFGREVHVSEQASPSTAQPDFQYANLSISNTTPSPRENVDISADITNNGDYGTAEAVYKEDGAVEGRRSVPIDAGATGTVVFTRSWPDFRSVEVAIDGLGPTTVSVVSEEIV